MPDALSELKVLIRTRHAIIRVQTHDEQDLLDRLARLARSLHMPLLVWNPVDGLSWAGDERPVQATQTPSLAEALRYLRDDSLQGLFVFLGAIKVLDDPAEIRLMRELAQRCTQGWSTVFLIDPGGDVPAELKPLTVPYDLGLPAPDEIGQIVADTVKELSTFQPVRMRLADEQRGQFIQHLRGLTRLEIRQLLARCALDDQRIDADDLPRVIDMKRRQLGEAGVLEFVPVDDPPRVGGLKALRRWLRLRKDALSDRARQFGLEPPRGVLLLGVQGCGKSLMARATAARWSLPLLRMEVGALYDKFIGETERHLRKAFAQTEAMSPCVLWIDEIEKAFASASGHNVDGGLSQRMFGALLTWLQEHKKPVFVIATANDISALPPELMRKGRFDEVFFIDLPGQRVRAQIAAIHLMRRGRDYHQFDVRRIGAAAEGFSGSEIEQAIVSALYVAFGDQRELTTDDILAEIARTRPLSVTAAEKIDQLRTWAADRCVMADEAGGAE